jgi:hypothetical protein
MRELLTEARTYHVHSQGSDENDGLSAGIEGAFASWQAAIKAVAALDFNGHDVTIQHDVEPAATVFTEPVKIPPLVGGGVLAICGSPTPGGTVFDVPTGCWTLDRVGPTSVTFRDLTLRGGGSGLINVQSGAIVSIGSGVVFGPGGFAHVYVHDSMSMAYILNAQYSITGNASYHLFVNGGMLFMEEMAVTLEGERSFPGGFACALNGGKIQTVTTTFTGTSTGPRFSVTANGVINTFLGPEAGAEYFPGSWEGHISTGGQYL